MGACRCACLVSVQTYIQLRCHQGVTQQRICISYRFTFRNICSSSLPTKENSVEHKSWDGLDGFPTPLSPTAGPEGAGNGLSGVYHSQAEFRAAGLTAWPCGGDVRRCGRGPRRGDLAFVLQTQSNTLIYLFAAWASLACKLC